jgi:uncharacterized repeat protein (TIGR03803 family)
MCTKTLTVLIALLVLVGAAWGDTESVLYTFTGGSDGGNPIDAGRLVRSGSNFYGTTDNGGQSGCGVIFELSGSSLTTLYAFHCNGDGANPVGNVVLDAAGNIYGTTGYGGSDDCGTVFEFSGSTLTTLYSFTCGDDGAFPVAGVFRDMAGNLYGTASSGGTNGGGVVYEITAAGTFSVLYNFCSISACADGQYPEASLVLDAGNLYGTTYEGGTTGCYSKAGCGTVFELSVGKGGGWKESVLHRFTGEGEDGAYPNLGALTVRTRQIGKNRTIVISGVTFDGGAGRYGTVYELTQAKPGYTMTVLHAFTDLDGDGGWPLGTLFDLDGKLIGTTQVGGSSGYGTVFELTNRAPGKDKGDWTETVLYSFTNGSDGGYPESGVFADSTGELWGVASAGGSSGYGVVYSLDP